jgi:hypothetical protein
LLSVIKIEISRACKIKKRTNFLVKYISLFLYKIKIENIKIIELTNLFNGKKKLSIILKNDKIIVAKINCLENEYKLGSNVPFKK